MKAFLFFVGILSFASASLAESLKPYDLRDLGVENRGFYAEASTQAKESFREHRPRCSMLFENVQDSMNSYGVTIRKNNETIFQMRREGASFDQLFKLYSASKFITVVMFGAFLEKHPDIDLSTKVGDYVDFGRHPHALTRRRQKQMTLNHLISMESGIRWCEYPSCLAIDVLKSTYGRNFDDTLKYVLSKKVIYTPGARYNYSSANLVLLHAFMRNYLGEDRYRNVYRDYLFRPLGIDRFAVESDGKGLFLGGFGVWLTQNGFAKIGQLIVNKGRWGSKTVLSPQYVQHILTPVKSLSKTKSSIKKWAGPAGAAVWTNKKVRGFQQRIEGIAESLVFSSGLYGQFLTIFPEHNTVITRVGGDFTHEDRWYLFTRDATACFGHGDMFDESRFHQTDRGEGPGWLFWKLEAVLQALPARIPMNAYALEMCSCLFTGNAIAKGVRAGINHCNTLRPVPNELLDTNDYELRVSPANKTLQIFKRGKPHITSTTGFVNGGSCKFLQRSPI